MDFRVGATPSTRRTTHACRPERRGTPRHAKESKIDKNDDQKYFQRVLEKMVAEAAQDQSGDFFGGASGTTWVTLVAIVAPTETRCLEPQR